MVLEIGSPSEAWRALSKIADETEDVAYDRTKREIKTLEIGVNKSVTEYFARVHVVLMKLEGHNIITPARAIKRIVLFSPSVFYFAVCCTRCPCHCLHAWVVSHRL